MKQLLIGICRWLEYYDNDDPEIKMWKGYDAVAQTADASTFIETYDSDKPFALVLSFGPPHSPYDSAPQGFKDLYDERDVELRANVPSKGKTNWRTPLAGYYAHCSVLDLCVGRLLDALDEKGIADDTIFVFTSDHGDMIGSHGKRNKQQAYDESLCVPFLLRYPKKFGRQGKELDAMLNTPDIMPTLLSLSGLPIPETVEGIDYAEYIDSKDDPTDGAAYICCIHPFGQWHSRNGGREYRGLRTERYTYVEDLTGPWMFFDNKRDPFQLENLVKSDRHKKVMKQFSKQLAGRLEEMNDEFKPGMDYIQDWNYHVDETGTVPYEE